MQYDSDKNNENKDKGYSVASGVTLHLAHCVFAGLALLLVSFLARGFFAIGMDDSDVDGWHRSGLKVLRDAKTGVEYLSDGKGGLVKREQSK